MIVKCAGWAKLKHPPFIIRHKAPFNDTGVTDGICEMCEKDLAAEGK